MFPLKCVWIPYFLQIFLKLSPSPWVYGMTMCPMLGFSLGGPSFWISTGAGCALCWAVTVAITIILSVAVIIYFEPYVWCTWDICTCPKPPVGAVSPFGRVLDQCNMFWPCGWEYLWHYLAEKLWGLSHCKYWSLWVGLWYTVMDKELSASALAKVLRKKIDPFS